MLFEEQVQADREEYNHYLDQCREHEEREIQVTCDAICASADIGTAKELEDKGWQLGDRSQFCWFHSKGVAR